MNRSSFTTASIQSLLLAVQKSLQVVVPIAQELHLQWREPNNYSEWDCVAGGIYRGFVVEVIKSSKNWYGGASLIDYDKRVVDYSAFSYIAVEFGKTQYPFICFTTTISPFDTCLVAELDKNNKVDKEKNLKFEQCKFVAINRLADGQRSVIDTLTWD